MSILISIAQFCIAPYSDRITSRAFIGTGKMYNKCSYNSCSYSLISLNQKCHFLVTSSICIFNGNLWSTLAQSQQEMSTHKISSCNVSHQFIVKWCSIVHFDYCSQALPLVLVAPLGLQGLGMEAPGEQALSVSTHPVFGCPVARTRVCPEPLSHCGSAGPDAAICR